MSLGSGGSAKRMAPLHLWVMAAALVVAAFAGGGLGLVWQSSSWAQGNDADAEETSDEDSADEGIEEET